eukprot:Opistho-1_new@34807
MPVRPCRNARTVAPTPSGTSSARTDASARPAPRKKGAAAPRTSTTNDASSAVFPAMTLNATSTPSGLSTTPVTTTPSGVTVAALPMSRSAAESSAATIERNCDSYEVENTADTTSENVAKAIAAPSLSLSAPLSGLPVPPLLGIPTAGGVGDGSSLEAVFAGPAATVDAGVALETAAAAEEAVSVACEQRDPSNPSGHTHSTPLPRRSSTHVPPLWHTPSSHRTSASPAAASALSSASPDAALGKKSLPGSLPSRAFSSGANSVASRPSSASICLLSARTWAASSLPPPREAIGTCPSATPSTPSAHARATRARESTTASRNASGPRRSKARNSTVFLRGGMDGLTGRRLATFKEWYFHTRLRRLKRSDCASSPPSGEGGALVPCRPTWRSSATRCASNSARTASTVRALAAREARPSTRVGCTAPRGREKGLLDPRGGACGRGGG